jgi:hypothetical protein
LWRFQMHEKPRFCVVSTVTALIGKESWTWLPARQQNRRTCCTVIMTDRSPPKPWPLTSSATRQRIQHVLLYDISDISLRQRVREM